MGGTGGEGGTAIVLFLSYPILCMLTAATHDPTMDEGKFLGLDLEGLSPPGSSAGTTRHAGLIFAFDKGVGCPA